LLVADKVSGTRFLLNWSVNVSIAGNETILYFLQDQIWTSLVVESYHKQSPASVYVDATHEKESIAAIRQALAAALIFKHG